MRELRAIIEKQPENITIEEAHAALIDARYSLVAEETFAAEGTQPFRIRVYARHRYCDAPVWLTFKDGILAPAANIRFELAR